MRIMALAVLTSVLVVGVAGWSPSRVRAAPRIILLHDGLMSERRVFMTDWKENLAFMVSTTESADVDPEELERAPAVKVALFWHGPTWENYANDPEALKTLSSDLAEQHARIYPASQTHEALFVFKSIPAPNPRLARRLGPEGIEILRKYGVLVD